MEIQRVPGLDFEELGLVSGIVIPPKFKVPLFAKYDGVSCPKMHLRSYVRKIQPHSTDKEVEVSKGLNKPHMPINILKHPYAKFQDLQHKIAQSKTLIFYC